MQVEYTPSFKKALTRILSCGEGHYSHKVLRGLMSQIKSYKLWLEANPYMGAIEPLLDDMELQYRHIIISPCFKLIYSVYDEKIYFSSIWDTRRNPESLVEEITKAEG